MNFAAHENVFMSDFSVLFFYRAQIQYNMKQKFLLCFVVELDETQ